MQTLEIVHHARQDKTRHLRMQHANFSKSKHSSSDINAIVSSKALKRNEMIDDLDWNSPETAAIQAI